MRRADGKDLGRVVVFSRTRYRICRVWCAWGIRRLTGTVLARPMSKAPSLETARACSLLTQKVSWVKPESLERAFTICPELSVQNSWADSRPPGDAVTWSISKSLPFAPATWFAQMVRRQPGRGDRIVEGGSRRFSVRVSPGCIGLRRRESSIAFAPCKSSGQGSVDVSVLPAVVFSMCSCLQPRGLWLPSAWR